MCFTLKLLKYSSRHCSLLSTTFLCEPREWGFALSLLDWASDARMRAEAAGSCECVHKGFMGFGIRGFIGSCIRDFMRCKKQAPQIVLGGVQRSGLRRLLRV